MPPHVTLKQLRYFDALAREQHAQNVLPHFAFLDVATLNSDRGTEVRFELRNLGANAG